MTWAFIIFGSLAVVSVMIAVAWLLVFGGKA